jgi:2-polyprenyl-3-methyl-5-hydroxy-6-metoxy-1,4-benzoquinol methylase
LTDTGEKKTVLNGWPEKELEFVVDCPICGDPQSRLLYDELTDRAHRSASGTWKMQQCDKCGSAYLNPRPIPASIWRAYVSYYTHKSQILDTEYLGARERLRRVLRNGYVNRLYGTSLRPATTFGATLVPLLGIKRAIDYSLRDLPRGPAHVGNVLDIGCGSGDYLRLAVEMGWQATGLDPDPQAAALESGLNVKKGGLPETGLSAETFDVVTLSHVIEHVHDPVASLREVHRVLKPGGRIWIATPNLESCSHRRFGKNWIGLQAPGHLVLFNRLSMAHALNAAGFEDLHFAGMHRVARGYFTMSWRIAQGESPFDPGNPLPFRQRIVAALSDLKAAFQPCRREEIVVIARKPLRALSEARS